VCESARWELHVAAAALRNYWRQRARGQQPRHLATYRCRYDRKERDAA
jgi:hypothetical protein